MDELKVHGRLFVAVWVRREEEEKKEKKKKKTKGEISLVSRGQYGMGFACFVVRSCAVAVGAAAASAATSAATSAVEGSVQS